MRIGVFICKCRGEISSHIDYGDIITHLKKFEDVVLVDEQIALCSSNSYDELIKKIKNHEIERVVIAACSPKYYEDIFRKNIEVAGLNPGFLEMANIREQCAWPHKANREEATRKAKLLIKVAIEKVKYGSKINLEKSKVKKSVMVIGAGIAGMHAALSLAKQGLEVHLVEKKAVIGGDQVRFAKVFPRDECSPCAFAPIIAQIVNNPNITVHTLSEVKSVGGRVGEYQIKLINHPRYVDEKKCINCGDCTTVCPSEIENQYEFGLGNHKRIHIPYEEAHPHSHVVSEKTVDDCRRNCHRYCEKICVTKAVNLDMQPTELDFIVGGIIVATGHNLYKPHEFNYNNSDNVLTMAEYERLLVADGVTKGKILRLSDKSEPNAIAFILCVGSRDPKIHPYCSKYCCMATATMITQTREKLPNVKIYVFYKDIQTVGKMGDEYVRRTQEMKDVEWIRAIPEDSKIINGDRLSLKVNASGGYMDIDVDLVVLANALEPSADTDKLRQIVGLDKTEEGFYRESDILLNPVSTFDPGKYICGTCVGPKTIGETITEARSAAASCASVLGADEIIQEVLVSKVDENKCGNCKVCLRTCVFGAVKIDEEKEVSVTDNTLCRGCGNCVSACPSGARDLIMFPNDFYKKAIDIMAEYETDEPKILFLACNGCAYPAADNAAQIGKQYPSNLLILRTPCAGRVDTQYIEYALAKGFDGVMIGMCHIGSCHYVVGNEDLMKRMDLLYPLLEIKGISRKRIRVEEISPSEGEKFVQKVNDFLDQLKPVYQEENIKQIIDEMKLEENTDSAEVEK
jgi:heterodisulfide reductase subunit A2